MLVVQKTLLVVQKMDGLSHNHKLNCYSEYLVVNPRQSNCLKFGTQRHHQMLGFFSSYALQSLY